MGDLKAEREQNMLPLLVLPSPGLSYEYLENLEALTISQRRVAFADLRTGAAAPDALVGRILDAVAALESPGGVHLLGYGYGAALALRVYSSSAVSSGAVCGYWLGLGLGLVRLGARVPCNPMRLMLQPHVAHAAVLRSPGAGGVSHPRLASGHSRGCRACEARGAGDRP